MIDFLLKDYEFFDNGRIKEIAFIINLNFSQPIEFKINCEDSNFNEIFFNYLGNKYSLKCEIKELIYYDILSNGIKLSDLYSTIEYSESGYQLIEEKELNDSLFDFQNAHYGGFLNYKFLLDTITLIHCKEKVDHNKHTLDYLLNAKDCYVSSYNSLSNKGNWNILFKDSKFNSISDTFAQFLYKVNFKLNLFSEDNEENYKVKPNIELTVNLLEYNEGGYSEIGDVNLKAAEIDYYHNKKLYEDYTIRELNKFYINYKNTFLCECFLGNETINAVNFKKEVYLFVFKIGDFVKINWDIFFNNKITFQGDFKVKLDFRLLLSKIKWVIYDYKILMFVEVEINEEPNSKYVPSNLYKTANRILIEQDNESEEEPVLIFDLNEPFKIKNYKKYFDDIDYSGSVEEEYRPTEADEEWEMFDDETRMQVDPDRFIDSFNDEDNDFSYEYDYDAGIQKKIDEVTRINISVLELELFSLEIIKLKILLTPRYLSNPLEEIYEISSLFMFRLKNLGTENLTNNFIYLGKIEFDFFVAILYENNLSKEYLDKFFDITFELLCDKKNFKLYKGFFKKIIF